MPRGKLTKNDWINAGLNTRVKKGIDSVRVELMSKQLKVSRGSFYWHFKNRQEWLNKILERWRETATITVIRRFNYEQMSPNDILVEMTSLPHHGESAQRAADIELAIRAWARRDDAARTFVDEVDQERMSFLTEIFRQIDPNSSVVNVQNKAFILYSLLLSESLVKYNVNPESRSSRAKYIIEKLLQ